MHAVVPDVNRWGSVVVRARWLILAIGLAAAITGAIVAPGLFDRLGSGGFADPGSESAQAARQIEAELGRQDLDVIVLYRPDDAGLDDAAMRQAVDSKAERLREVPLIKSVVVYYDSALLVKLADPDERRRMDQFRELEGQFAAPGLRETVGGRLAFVTETQRLATADMARAELVTLPLLLLLLILIFRGAVTAAAPVLIAALSILGAMVALRALTLVTEVSMFAIHVITIIGLGLAVDYALLIVARFREELRHGRAVPIAVAITVATAGRTVAISGITVSLAMSSLLLFPQPFLRSMAYGSAATVGLATVTALSVLPALLAVLGHRINAARIPLPVRHSTETRWRLFAWTVMRRPLLYGGLAVIALIMLVAPFRAVQFGPSDVRTLPVGSPSREVAERIAATEIQVLIKGENFIRGVPNVAAVRTIAGNDRATLIGVDVVDGLPTAARRQVVADIRSLARQSDVDALVGGPIAIEADTLAALGRWLPFVALYATLVLLAMLSFAFGSLVVPVKALAMGLVSLGATYGVLVWGFQEGNLSGLLGFTEVGYLEPLQLAMLWPILFGLSVDYEVFVLARVREEWLRTGDNPRSVALGLSRTGPIISSAGALFVVVALGFATTSGLILTKTGAVGIAVAIIIDVTLVRAILVPATMRLLGRYNWWAPWPRAMPTAFRPLPRPYAARRSCRAPAPASSQDRCHA